MSLRTKKIILGVSILLLLLAFMIVNLASVDEIVYVILVPAVLIWLLLYVMWWRCPHCGRGLGRFHFGTHYCPYCGDELYDD